MIQSCIVNTVPVKKDYVSLSFSSMSQYRRVKEKPQHHLFRLAIVIFQFSLENMKTKLKAYIDIPAYQVAKWISALLPLAASIPLQTVHLSLHGASGIACVAIDQKSVKR